MSDLVTIPAGESINLSFVREGVLHYNGWFDAENPKGTISPTAAVYVEAGG